MPVYSLPCVLPPIQCPGLPMYDFIGATFATCGSRGLRSGMRLSIVTPFFMFETVST